MNRLPNMMVLDFCEFLKRKAKSSHSNSRDTFSLIFDESYSHKLQSLAEEYLAKSDYSFKGLLHRYIDSEYFDRSLHKFPPEMRSNECRRCTCCERGFLDFLDNLSHNEEYPQYDVDAYDLANSLRATLRNEPKDVVLHFMTSLGIDFDCEIDFLEWLMDSLDEPLSIRKMPVSVFEGLVDSYLEDSKKGERAKRQLLKSFKQTDSWAFDELLDRIFPYQSAKRAKSMRQVLGRYYEQNIPYKCVFLPLSAETEEYKSLISNYWRDLHTISGDYLDIYYSETDYGKSGAEIQSNLKSLPTTTVTKYPCIMIWTNDISKATSIDIGGLTNREIIDVVVSIVNAIKTDKTLVAIVDEANSVVKDIRKKSRPMSNMVTVIGDKNSVFGIVNGGEVSVETN